ncbi:uncharacterized protein LOC141643452 [Silene latifolia]|uniref:uncharacterized protein LOC141643452 n=1 Tax=Silene latifolia TaxID=37657 RepID=UPI003D78B0C9
METLYKKLYEKYSKLKSSKENQMEQINNEQEVKFFECVSAAELYIKHLEKVNKRLSENTDELRNEVVSVRSALDQQFHEFQDRLKEEKQKNQQLALEIEKLRNLQHERTVSHNRSDQRVNRNYRSPTVSDSQIDETPVRITRKRARLLEELEKSDAATSSPAVGNVHLSGRKELPTDLSKSDISKTECCQVFFVNGGPCKCMFHGLLEYMIGMELSAAVRPEGKSLNVVHPPSGYSFSLTCVNKPDGSEVELLYNVTSLGTFAAVAPEWMREVMMFSLNMCPIFFERLSRVIKHH